jgi:hypothetical protein
MVLRFRLACTSEWCLKQRSPVYAGNSAFQFILQCAMFKAILWCRILSLFLRNVQMLSVWTSWWKFSELIGGLDFSSIPYYVFSIYSMCLEISVYLIVGNIHYLWPTVLQYCLLIFEKCSNPWSVWRRGWIWSELMGGLEFPFIPYYVFNIYSIYLDI